MLQHITLVHIDKIGGAEDDDEEDADTTAASTAEAVLRDCKYNLHVTMMASNRCLKAREVFDTPDIFDTPDMVLMFSAISVWIFSGKMWLRFELTICFHISMLWHAPGR